MNKSFTLLEVMLAISVMTLAVSGSFILIQQTLVAASLAQSRLIAGYLTQEGFEIVRNIRDSTWLAQRTTTILWDEGIPAGDWEADYTTQGLSQYYDAGHFLSIDTQGFYSYSPGQPTIFKRKITVTKITAVSIEVEILVTWQERGRPHQLSAQEYLYNWK